MLSFLICILIAGWVAAATIGTQAYFRGEQTKPIHERNLKSPAFERIAETVTGRETNHAERVLSYGIDAYASKNLSNS